MLDVFNPFVRRFKFAAAANDPDLHLRIAAAPHLGQQRRYNKAVAPEIALFRPDMEPDMDSTPRDIVLRVRGLQPQLKFISEWNAAYNQNCNCWHLLFYFVVYHVPWCFFVCDAHMMP